VEALLIHENEFLSWVKKFTETSLTKIAAEKLCECFGYTLSGETYRGAEDIITSVEGDEKPKDKKNKKKSNEVKERRKIQRLNEIPLCLGMIVDTTLSTFEGGKHLAIMVCTGLLKRFGIVVVKGSQQSTARRKNETQDTQIDHRMAKARTILFEQYCFETQDNPWDYPASNNEHHYKDLNAQIEQQRKLSPENQADWLPYAINNPHSAAMMNQKDITFLGVDDFDVLSAELVNRACLFVQAFPNLFYGGSLVCGLLRAMYIDSVHLRIVFQCLLFITSTITDYILTNCIHPRAARCSFYWFNYRLLKTLRLLRKHNTPIDFSNIDTPASNVPILSLEEQELARFEMNLQNLIDEALLLWTSTNSTIRASRNNLHLKNSAYWSKQSIQSFQTKVAEYVNKHADKISRKENMNQGWVKLYLKSPRSSQSLEFSVPNETSSSIQISSENIVQLSQEISNFTLNDPDECNPAKRQKLAIQSDNSDGMGFSDVEDDTDFLPEKTNDVPKIIRKRRRQQIILN